MIPRDTRSPAREPQGRVLGAVVIALALATTSSAASPPAADRTGPLFSERAADWGIDFRHRHGGEGEFFMTETMGSGVAIFDYDGDGDDDVFLVDSGSPAPHDGERSHSRLYRNDGPGRFVDVTEASGIVVTGYGMGATAADVDDDGDPDLYVTAFGANQLFENRGNGSFVDVTERAGVGDPLWSSSAAFADGDADGDLDLYVVNYVDFDYDNNEICGVKERGLRSYCHPNVYRGLPDRYYRNRGDGTFEDATDEAGFGDADGNGLGVTWLDFDADGSPDVYVANDMTPNFLFRNRGDGTFEEVALLAGTALDHRGEPEAGMGVGVGDLDGNGHEDLVVTHLDRQTNALYSNLGTGLFLDRRFNAQLANPSLPMVGFGVVVQDFDLDGWVDLVIANGHIIHNVEEYDRGTTFRQPNQLFLNRGDGSFVEVEAAGLTVIRSSRGAASGDLDLDGDADLVISNSDEEVEVYENVVTGAEWLAVDLRGSGPVPGTRLTLRTGQHLQRRYLRTGDSYQSQSSAGALFGLPGAAPYDSSLIVEWPDGTRRRIASLPGRVRVAVVR